jgi:hypothetical protein
VLGAVRVRVVLVLLIPIFIRGLVVSADREPYDDRPSIVVNCVNDPGLIVTLRDAGDVGAHTRPSATGDVPNVALIRYPRAIIASWFVDRMSVSCGISPG